MSTENQKESITRESWSRNWPWRLFEALVLASFPISRLLPGTNVNNSLSIALSALSGSLVLLIVILETSRHRRRILAFTLDLLARFVLRQPLGPGFGLVTERLHDLNLESAIPQNPPPPMQVETYGNVSGPTPQLARAASWAIALHDFMERTQFASQISPAVRLVTTTVGFVRFRDGSIKLAVIRYVNPGGLIPGLLGPQPVVSFAGETFRVVKRPWLPEPHNGKSGCDGHCWVTFGDPPTHRGVVTAGHVLHPTDAAVNDEVIVKTLRSDIRGTLRHSSKIMDAALVEVNEDAVPDLLTAPYSSVIGFKPVRFMTGKHQYQPPIEGDITGFSGFSGAIYPKQPGGEPVAPALMTMNKSAMHGDSGCVILDIEYDKEGHTPPYLVYEGVINLGRGTEGYGLYLGQVADQWRVSTHITNASSIIHHSSPDTAEGALPDDRII